MDTHGLMHISVLLGIKWDQTWTAWVWSKLLPFHLCLTCDSLIIRKRTNTPSHAPLTGELTISVTFEIYSKSRNVMDKQAIETKENQPNQKSQARASQLSTQPQLGWYICATGVYDNWNRHTFYVWCIPLLPDMKWIWHFQEICLSLNFFIVCTCAYAKCCMHRLTEKV